MVTLHQINAANPQAVLDMINSWKTSAKEMLDHAGTYRDLVTLPGGLPWSGQTRDAAVTMAGRDYSAIDQVHDALDAMADAAATGMDPVISNLNAVRDLIAQATSAGFHVNDDLSVTRPQAPVADILDPKGKELGERYERDIKAAAQKWWDSEQAVANQINSAKQNLAARFNALGALNADEGRQAGSDLISNHFLSPQEQERLIAAGSLTQAQLDRLARGERVEVGAGRMAYLYQLSQSLNGKSPAEIAALMDGLPPQAAAALSQGLAIVSNHNAISGVPNTQGATDATRSAFIPAAGSVSNLPSGIVAELTRTDRITHGMSTAGAGSGAMARPETTLRGVGALQDIAKIFKPAGAGYLNGSEATKSMLAAASQYAEADATHRGALAANPVVAPDQLTVDHHGGGSDPRNALAQIVGVAGQDHVGVHDLVTDPRTRDGFLHGILTDQWGDASGQVGDAFRWMGDDPHNRIDAETANGVAHYISAHSGELQHMPGGGTFAADNPGVAQAMAVGLGPYLAQLAGADPSLFNAPGVESFHQRQDMANLFSTFDSDHGAGVTINNAALQQQQFLETHAAHFGIQGNEVEVASRLHQAMLDGADQARHFDQTNQVSQAAKGDAAMGTMWDTGYGALTAATGLTGATVPGAQLPAAVLARWNPRWVHRSRACCYTPPTPPPCRAMTTSPGNSPHRTSVPPSPNKPLSSTACSMPTPKSPTTAESPTTSATTVPATPSSTHGA
ncbi:TPR repeat region-containing protein [Mycobacterium sp. ML4]